jgi:hypothetical protein
VTVEELGGGSNKSTGDRRRGDEGAATATGAQRAVVRGEVQKEDEGFEGGGAHNGRRLTVVRVVTRVEKEDVAERALPITPPGPFC